MAGRFDREAAELEANEIAFRFRNSSDVVGDMSRAYHTDFSGIRMHEDAAAQARVRAAGTDALAKGSDLYFRKGILSGHDQASRGLVAHELAHTMQQGIVAGNVQESAPAGAEQGGFVDWIKGLFSREGRKKRKLNSFAKKSARARNKVGEIESEAIPQELKNRSSALMQESVHNSNATWDSQAHPTEEGRTSGALAALGVRNSSTDVGKADMQMRKNVFKGSQNNYSQYMHALDASGVDFTEMLGDVQALSRETGASHEYNDYSLSMTQDLYRILERYLMSENGLEYIAHFKDHVGSANVFRKGQGDVMDYIMQTLVTGESAAMMRARGMGEYKQNKDEMVDARNKTFTMASRGMMLPMLVTTMSEEEQKALPQGLQSLFAQYNDIKKRLAEALQAKEAAITQGW